MTEEKLDGVGTLLEVSLKMPLCLLALHCWFPKHTAPIGTKLLIFCPQIFQCCRWFQMLVFSELLDLELTI